MVGGDAAWWLTALFGMTALFHTGRIVVSRGSHPVDFAADGLHVLMSVAMVAMVWPWGMRVPAIGYGAVFTAAAAWFGAVAMYRLGPAHAGHGGVLGAWYHAAMMASMVWMALVMSVSAEPLAVVTAGGRSAGGMAMAGMSMPASSPGGAPAPSGAMPGWAGWSCRALAVGFAVAALIFIAAALRASLSGGRAAPLARFANGLMAAGMSIGFALMA
jgi:hypothetical protein